MEQPLLKHIPEVIDYIEEQGNPEKMEETEDTEFEDDMEPSESRKPREPRGKEIIDKFRKVLLKSLSEDYKKQKEYIENCIRDAKITYENLIKKLDEGCIIRNVVIHKDGIIYQNKDIDMEIFTIINENHAYIFSSIFDADGVVKELNKYYEMDLFQRYVQKYFGKKDSEPQEYIIVLNLKLGIKFLREKELQQREQQEQQNEEKNKERQKQHQPKKQGCCTLF